MQFTATIALGLMPLLVFGGAAVLQPAPAIVPKHVATEGVTARRIDDATFRGRWRPLYDVPPATVIQMKGGETHSLREITGKPVGAVARTVPPAVRVKRASLLHRDVCARHGLVKVTYRRGNWQGWRCRKSTT